ncbi:hypothetical protein BC30048_4426 [Bacillus cereus]|uniref:DUF3990 domain-containing protein n=1 Tax=Bacillus cereus group TaxID=86661 RepID=UPI000789FAA8|nr:MULTISPECIES: DUF3990 domain-containing protein [Bacillus cereus group]KYQ00960.1 hypothetical protein B4079_3877 [Bacillus cereus]MED1214298.1 DUF3990 domain-containing protein [Bacillus paranthracis]BCC14001.1 hypothetical protein BCM0074_4384 [Bacillus cereus]BCD01524.1 hypothetical protein BC30048_4426 [Bacillus cereus]HDR6306059.1 DUF3990 domain-containing protein [Bacillus cereus]
MNLQFDPQQFFYHGTVDIFGNLISEKIIIVKRKNKGVDFGSGFYLTTNLTKAKIWAKDKAKYAVMPASEVLELLQMTPRDFLSMKKELKPVVLKYRIKDHEKWLNLNNKIFTKESLNWKQHILEWRKRDDIPSEWDWTYGPVADGGINQQDYHLVKAIFEMDQMAVHNELRANELLELVEVIPC